MAEQELQRQLQRLEQRVHEAEADAEVIKAENETLQRDLQNFAAAAEAEVDGLKQQLAATTAASADEDALERLVAAEAENHRTHSHARSAHACTHVPVHTHAMARRGDGAADGGGER